MTEEDSTEVSGAEMADELEMAEVETAVGGESGGGVDGGPMWIGFAMVEDGGGSGGCGRREKRFVETESKTRASETRASAGRGESAVGDSGCEAEVEIGVVVHGMGCCCSCMNGHVSLIMTDESESGLLIKKREESVCN